MRVSLVLVGRHYQDAYDMLIIMFGLTEIPPLRSKRWVKAKVLADRIDITLALLHHNTHNRQFGDFSRGWGIGGESFEF